MVKIDEPVLTGVDREKGTPTDPREVFPFSTPFLWFLSYKVFHLVRYRSIRFIAR
jgi:hypothetical protein